MTVSATLVAGLLAALLASAAPASAAPQIHTVAGGGKCGVQTNPPTIPNPLDSGGLCDGVSPTSVVIGGARSVSALPGGGFLYIDAYNDLVREVVDGTVTTVAGDGSPADGGTVDAPDGALAVDSGLEDPVSVAALPNGGFVITEFGDSVVRMVSPGTPQTATITTIAGTGAPGGENDLSGPATSVPLNYPTDAEPTADGGVLIADTYNNFVRYLSPDGSTITTVAGVSPMTIAAGGTCNDDAAANPCEGMPANQVQLDLPDSVSPIQGGAAGFLISEYGDSAIREVSQETSGTFSTVAGTPGAPGYSGDFGPATSAQLDDPEQVASTPDGGFLIADTNNDVIRQVQASGMISTLAGNGVASLAGDGKAAAAASLNGPSSISLTPDSNILIADENNNVIREITVPPAVKVSLSPSTLNGTDGWYITPVTAKVSATEGATISCELDPGTAPPVFAAIPPGCPYTGSGASISTNGPNTIYAAAQNSFGDTSSVTKVSVMIDATLPTMKCVGTPTFRLGQRHAQVSATLSDTVSGPPSEPVSAPADTSSLGKQTAFVMGINVAGGDNVALCPYKVVAAYLNPTPVTTWTFSAGLTSTTVKRLIVTHVQAGALVNVTCHGKGCPFSVRRSVGSKAAHSKACHGKACRHSKQPKQRTVDLTSLFKGSRLAPGTELVVAITKPDTIGGAVVFTIRAGQAVAHRPACLDPGSLVPRKKCS